MPCSESLATFAPRHDEKSSDAEDTVHVQCADYALESLTHAILRSHYTMTLVDRDRFQLMYYDRGVIMVSKPIDISVSGPDDIELYIVMLVRLHLLTDAQRGQLSVIDDSRKFLTDYNWIKRNHPDVSVKNMDPDDLFVGMVLRLDDDKIVLTLGRRIYRQPGIIGRGTCVVHATSESNGLRGKKLVVKFSWPGETRTAEDNFLAAAKAKAEELSTDGKRHWVLDHLPHLFHAENVDLEDGDSTPARVANFLNNAEYVNNCCFAYENRTLRITVQELLYPVDALTSAEAVAQVFMDVLQGLSRFSLVVDTPDNVVTAHKWLYDHPQILHRDISLGNIMFRYDDSGHICGVLNDFDLSSYRKDLLEGSPSTSLQRTGTPPFMALDLLKDNGGGTVRHLYRHDLESLFYVLVIVLSHHQYDMPTEGLPEGEVQKATGLKLRTQAEQVYDHWFDARKTWTELYEKKRTFFEANAPEVIGGLSEDFEAMKDWVESLRKMFKLGYRALSDSNDREAQILVSEDDDADFFSDDVVESPTTKPDFDIETLGQHVTYMGFLGSVKVLRLVGITPRLRYRKALK